MTTPADPAAPEPLPPQARLLHIGLPKTGTTALQSTAQARREALLELGVRYPGGGLNHREAVSALMKRRWGWIGPGAAVPPMRHWDRLIREIGGDTTSRVWISHEFASESDDESAARFVEALGERIHVVVTLRPFGAMLTSSWQQYLKGGTSHTFEYWLRSVLAEPPKRTVTPSFHGRNDQSGVVRRWAAAAGQDRVTVVVVDKAVPTRLTDAFEAMLDLPPGFLVDDSLGGLQGNRAFSKEEAELMRQVNLAVKGQPVDWPEYERLLREGGIARLLQARTPAPDEHRLELPRWAADQATDRGQRYAAEVAASGVRVIGDLAALAVPAAGTDEPYQAPTHVSLDIATAMVVGTLSAGLGRGAFFGDQPPPPSPSSPPPRGRTVKDMRTRELVREVGARVGRLVKRTVPTVPTVRTVRASRPATAVPVEDAGTDEATRTPATPG